MSRFLFWVALALLIYFAVRAKIRQSARRQQEELRRQYQQQHDEQMRQPARQVAPPETMLLCAHCGVHFPASENVPAGGRDYCSPGHVPH